MQKNSDLRQAPWRVKDIFCLTRVKVKKTKFYDAPNVSLSIAVPDKVFAGVVGLDDDKPSVH